MISYPKKFRKRPVVIEAMQLSADTSADPVTGAQACDLSLASIVGWMMGHGQDASVVGERRPFGLAIHTLEGVMEATPGDWIIRGTQGEFYPCKSNIFAETYEAV